MADVMEDNLAGSMRSLKSALEGVAISFSELGEGPIRSMVEWLTDMVRKFDNLSDKSKQWIVIFASIAEAIGPILLVIGTLVSWIPKVVAGFKMIGLVLRSEERRVGKGCRARGGREQWQKDEET